MMLEVVVALGISVVLMLGCALIVELIFRI